MSVDAPVPGPRAARQRTPLWAEVAVTDIFDVAGGRIQSNIGVAYAVRLRQRGAGSNARTGALLRLGRRRSWVLHRTGLCRDDVVGLSHHIFETIQVAGCGVGGLEEEVREGGHLGLLALQ